MGSAASRWKAIRCAPLGPAPGAGQLVDQVLEDTLIHRSRPAVGRPGRRRRDHHRRAVPGPATRARRPWTCRRGTPPRPGRPDRSGTRRPSRRRTGGDGDGGQLTSARERDRHAARRARDRGEASSSWAATSWACICWACSSMALGRSRPRHRGRRRGCCRSSGRSWCWVVVHGGHRVSHGGSPRSRWRRAHAGAARCCRGRCPRPPGRRDGHRRRGPARCAGTGSSPLRVGAMLDRAAAIDSGRALSPASGSSDGTSSLAQAGGTLGLVVRNMLDRRPTACTRGAVSVPGSAEGSTAVSIFQSPSTMSIAAWRRISSLPPPMNESRAPAVLNPIVRLVASTPITWAFWLSRIQVKRRIFFTASSRSGQIRRTSARERLPAAGLAGAALPVRSFPEVAGAGVAGRERGWDWPSPCAEGAAGVVATEWSPPREPPEGAAGAVSGADRASSAAGARVEPGRERGWDWPSPLAPKAPMEWLVSTVRSLRSLLDPHLPSGHPRGSRRRAPQALPRTPTPFAPTGRDERRVPGSRG